METLISVLGLVLGFIAGFGINHYLMLFILKGENIQNVLQDKTKKIWIGTLGWFIILIMTWIGWQLADHLYEQYLL